MNIPEPTSANPDNRFPKWLSITLAVFSVAMLSWQIAVCGGVAHLGDTTTYYQAWERLSTFHPDFMRPPVYPLIIGVLKTIFGQEISKVVLALLQWAIWIAGCRWTWLTMRYFNMGRKLANCVILLLMAFPGTWIFNNSVMTEGIMVGLMPLSAWLFIQYLRNKKEAFLIRAAILLFVFIFTKPQMMFLIPIWAFVWIYATRANKRHLTITAAATLLAIASLGIYKWSLYHCYRQNNMSTVTPMNNYYGLRMAGLVKVEEIQNPVSRETLRPYIEADPGQDRPEYYLYWRETWSLGSNALDSICVHAFRSHPAEATAFILHRIPQSLRHNIFFTPCKERQAYTPIDSAYHAVCSTVPKPDSKDIIIGADLLAIGNSYPFSTIYPLFGIMDFPFLAAWVIIVSFTLWYIVVWARRKRLPVAASYISAILLGGYLTVFIGAPNDWGRLVTPFSMLLFAAGGIMVANVKKTLSGWWLKRREFA